MKDTHVAKRYAHALFNVSLKKETLDIIASEIYQLKSFCDKDKRFVMFLSAPQVLTEHKIAMVKTLFTTRLSPSLLSFLLILIQKSRVDHLSEIALEFEKLLEKHKGLIKAKVFTAIHLDDDYKGRLREKIESLTGKQVEIIHKLKKEIMGGIIVQLNYNVMDRSVRKQLDTLKHDLLALKVY